MHRLDDDNSSIKERIKEVLNDAAELSSCHNCRNYSMHYNLFLICGHHFCRACSTLYQRCPVCPSLDNSCVQRSVRVRGIEQIIVELDRFRDLVFKKLGDDDLVNPRPKRSKRLRDHDAGDDDDGVFETTKQRLTIDPGPESAAVKQHTNKARIGDHISSPSSSEVETHVSNPSQLLASQQLVLTRVDSKDSSALQQQDATSTYTFLALDSLPFTTQSSEDVPIAGGSLLEDFSTCSNPFPLPRCRVSVLSESCREVVEELNHLVRAYTARGAEETELPSLPSLPPPASYVSMPQQQQRQDEEGRRETRSSQTSSLTLMMLHDRGDAALQQVDATQAVEGGSPLGHTPQNRQDKGNYVALPLLVNTINERLLGKAPHTTGRRDFVPILVECSCVSDTTRSLLDRCVEQGYIELAEGGTDERGQFRERRYQALVIDVEDAMSDGDTMLRLVRRSMAYIRALSRGIRVLEPAWLRASLQQGRPAKPAEYEISGSTVDDWLFMQGPQRSREGNRDSDPYGRSNLFEKIDFVFVREYDRLDSSSSRSSSEDSDNRLVAIPADVLVDVSCNDNDGTGDADKENSELSTRNRMYKTNKDRLISESVVRWMVEMGRGRVVDTIIGQTGNSIHDHKKAIREVDESDEKTIVHLHLFSDVRRYLSTVSGIAEAGVAGDEEFSSLAAAERPRKDPRPDVTLAWLFDCICCHHVFETRHSTH